jgi:acyl-CoA synthetase (AMP-forming)/AMP-acid ligase II
MGVKKGDVLGVLSWNCVEYADLFGAAEKGGFIIAPFNVRLSENEIDYLIKDSEAAILFVGTEFADMVATLKHRIPRVKHFISLGGSLPGMESSANLLERYPTHEPDVQVEDEDPLFICYTSGTTGRPRGALYTHRGHREDVICHALEVPIGYDDRGISLMPLFHIGGIAIQSYLFYQAATAVITKFFDCCHYQVF